MSSLFELLAAHEDAAARRVEELRGQIAALTAELGGAEEQLSRFRIAADVIDLVLASGVQVPPPVELGDVAAVESAPGVASVSQASSGPAMWTVPAREVGADVSVLPQGYRDVMEVVDDAGGGPVRAGHIAVALGLGTQARHREGMRSKCRRLAQRGWLVVDEEGLFALAPGVSGRIG